MQRANSSMNSNRCSLLPIGYVALVLIVTNLIGFVAVTYLERCSDNHSMSTNIDVIHSYLCFGVSFVFVTFPTMAASGAHLINRISSIFIILWSMLYMISLYFGVHDTLSFGSESEWMHWVALSFLYLLPFSMGLCRRFQMKPNPSILGLLLSTVGLLMLSLSSWRAWQHPLAPQTFSPSLDSWWGNCVFWFGIFLLNAHSTMVQPEKFASLLRGTHSRKTFMPPLLIISFVFGPGLLLSSHPFIQSFLYSMFYSSLLGMQQPPNNAFIASLVDPTLLRVVRLGHVSSSVHDSFSSPIVDENAQVRIYEILKTVDSGFTNQVSNCLFQSELSTENKENHVLFSEIQNEPELPVVRRIIKPATSFKTFLSKFKLTITTDVVNGHWN